MRLKLKTSQQTEWEFREYSVAQLLLNLLKNETKFCISCNESKMGPFGDILLNVNLDKEETKVAIHLKYSATLKKISAKSLTKSGGNLNILNYFKQYEKTSGRIVVVYSNRELSRKVHEISLRIGDKDVKLTLIDKPLYLSYANCPAYQFQLDNSKSPEDDLKELNNFLNSFYLCPRQSGTRCSKAEFRHNFKKEFKCDEKPASDFLEYIRSWQETSKKTNHESDEKYFASKLAEYLLEAFIADGQTPKDDIQSTEHVRKKDIIEASELLWEAFMQFGFTQIMHPISTLNPVFRRMISTKNQAANEENQKLPIILDVSEPCDQKRWHPIETILRLANSKTKIILFGNCCQSKSQPELDVWNNLNDLRKKTPELYEKVVGTFNLQFFGNETSLKDILHDIPQLHDMLTPTHLVESLLIFNEEGEEMRRTCWLCFENTKPVLQKDEQPEATSAPGSKASGWFFKKLDQMPRRFEMPCIDFEFVREIHERKIEDTLVLMVFNNKSSLKELKHCLIGVPLTPSSEYNSERNIYVCGDRNPEVIFDKLIQKNNARKCHLLEFNEESKHLLWIRSSNSIEDIQPHRLKQGHVVKEEQLFQKKQKINILCGVSGEGQSSFLKRLAKKYNSTFWILCLDFQYYHHLFHENVDYESFLRQTLRQIYGVQNQLLLDLFDAFLQQKRVILLWDDLGEEPYDENHREYILRAVMEFSQKGIQQWITAQKFLQDSLERRLIVLTTYWALLTKAEQFNLLDTTFNTKEEMNTYISRTPKSFDAFFGKVLQLYFLTQWSAEDMSTKSSYPSLLKVYDTYLRDKIKMKTIHQTNPYNITYKLLECYERIALRRSLEDDLQKKILPHNFDLTFIEHIAGYGDKCGIIQQVSSTYIPIFEHVTINDYLTARYLAKNKEKIACLEPLHPRYKRIKFFYDLIQTENCPLHTAVLYRDVDNIRIIQSAGDTKDQESRTPLMLALSWVDFQDSSDETLRDLLRKFDGNSTNLEIVEQLRNKLTKEIASSKDNLVLYRNICSSILYNLNTVENSESLPKLEENTRNGDSLWHLAAFYGNIDFFERFASSEKLNKFGEAPIHIAARKGHFEIIEFLHQTHADINLCCNKGRTPLSIASERGHLDIVNYLLRNKSDVNAKDEESKTPVMYACEHGHKEIVEELINSKALINDEVVCKCLHKAAANNHLDIVRLLLQEILQSNQYFARNLLNALAISLYAASEEGHRDVVEYLNNCGAATHAKSARGCTPICAASANGHLDVVKYLVQNKANVNDKDKEGRSCLWLAACGGHKDVVEYLVSQGNAGLEDCDKYGCSPLWVSSREGHMDIAKFLTEKGCDVNRKNKVGTTPFKCACQSGHLEVVQYLFDKVAKVMEQDEGGCNGFWGAAYEGHKHIVQYLAIEKQCDSNTGNNYGFRPLHVAAQRGHLDIVVFLTKHLSDVNVRTNDGKTPLHLAAQQGHLDLVKFLSANKATLDDSDKSGSTPFYLSCLNGHLSVVEFLHSKGADINSSTYDLCSPICAAASHGYLEIVEFLTENKAFLNPRDFNEATPIQLAAKKGHFAVVKYLLKQKVNADSADKLGRTPLWEAAYNNRLDLVQFLAKNGAYINSTTNNGITPLHAATRKGNIDIVKWLILQGADPDLCDVNGCTIACTTSLFGHKGLISFFKTKDIIEICQNNYVELTLDKSNLVLKDSDFEEFYSDVLQ